MAESDLWARIIASLRGDTYVPELEPYYGPDPFESGPSRVRRRKDLRANRMEELFKDTPKPSLNLPGESDLMVASAAAPDPFDVAPLVGASEPTISQAPLPSDESAVDLSSASPAPDPNNYPYEYDPAEYLRNYAANMDPGKLAKIRAQARLKGAAGSLSEPVSEEGTIREILSGGFGDTKGSFSQQEMSPELEMRLAARDRWAADQPMREQEFLASAEMARRNPQLAASAAKTLTEMQANKTVQKQQQIQNALVEQLGGGSGVIPFEQGMQLRAAGVNVPPQAIGMSPEEASSKIQGMLEYQSRSLSSMDPMEATLNPMLGVDYKNNRLAMSLIQDANTRIQQGENRDLVFKELMNDLMELTSLNISEKQRIAAQFKSQLAQQPQGE